MSHSVKSGRHWKVPIHRQFCRSWISATIKHGILSGRISLKVPYSCELNFTQQSITITTQQAVKSLYLTGCIAPLGMESRTILDAQISASSQVNGNHSASQARLYLQTDGSKFGGWSALTNDVNQWLQVDFGSYTLVTRIATQGENGYSNWVSKYRLKYSDDGSTFQFYKDVGSTSPKVLGDQHQISPCYIIAF